MVREHNLHARAQIGNKTPVGVVRIGLPGDFHAAIQIERDLSDADKIILDIRCQAIADVGIAVFSRLRGETVIFENTIDTYGDVIFEGITYIRAQDNPAGFFLEIGVDANSAANEPLGLGRDGQKQ